MGILDFNDKKFEENYRKKKTKRTKPRNKHTNPRARGTNPRARLEYDRKLAKEYGERLRHIKDI